MGAVIEDVLATRLELLGVSQFTGGISTATQAVFGLGGALDGVAGKRLSFGVGGIALATGAFALLAGTAADAGNEAADYNQAVRNLKGSLPLSEMKAFAGELERATGVDDGEIANLLGILGTFNVSGGDAKKLAEPILNARVALRALGLDSKNISNGVGKALQTGDASALRRSGIIIDDVKFKAASAAQRVQMLQDALNAQGGNDAARQFKKEWPGAIEALNSAVGDLREGIGAGLNGPLLKSVQLATDMANAINDLDPNTLANVGRGAAIGAGLIGVAGAAAVVSAVKLKKMADENVRLTNETLKAAKAAERQAGDEGADGAAMGTAAKRSKALADTLPALALAHVRAAEAAELQAIAEERLNRALGNGGGGGVNLPGGGGGGKGKSGGSVSLPDLGGAKGKRPAVKFDPDAPIRPGTATAKAVQEAEEIAAATAKKGGFKFALPKFGANTAEVVGDAAKLGRGAKMAATAAEIGSHLKGGLPAIVAGFGLNWALDQIPDEGSAGVTKHLAKGALNGAEWGATLGSVFPVIGTATGAAVGGAIGGGMAGWDEWQKTQPKTAEAKADTNQAMLDEMKKQTELLAAIKAGGDNSPIGYGQVSQFEQRRALARAVKV
jgi:hypothetical protein